MAKIKHLDPLIIQKIAAGQVVERPVSVVKELVENALDAGATSITVEILAGGTELIRIIDNGHGMDREDLLKCFLPYTTSKIFSDSDLHAIKTLGFRGEALASISAVSDLLIKSKISNEKVGYQVTTLYAGEPIIQTIPMNTGTVIEVKNLFANVPARKKFLKSAQTEYKYILKLLMAYSLSRENVSLRLSHNGKEIFNIPKSFLMERCELLLGKDVTDTFLSLDKTTERAHIHGFIAKPQAANSSTDLQYLFVNGRYVSSSIVSSAVAAAFADLLMAKTYIPFVLNLDLDAVLVDVNVHPRKEEIRFWDESYVYNLVYTSVTELLVANDLTYTYGESVGDSDGGETFYHIDKKALKGTFLRLKDSVDPWNPKGLSKDIDYTNNIQIFNTYILYQSSCGLTLIDQHAAHESILYEQFVQSYIDGKDKSGNFSLREAVILNLSLAENTVIMANLNALQDYGFDIEPFGNNSIKVLSLPQIFKDHNIVQLLKELLTDLQTIKGIKAVDEKTKKTLQFLSCRGAIKAAEPLTLAERVNLIEKLEQSIDTYVCPHGRPVKVVLRQSELERLFKRVK